MGSHRWERVVDEPDRIGYEFSRCLWAEISGSWASPIGLEPKWQRIACDEFLKKGRRELSVS